MEIMGDSPTPQRTRQRVLKACQPCRQRRRKCNGTEPCEACVGYGYDCHYAENERSRKRARHADAEIEEPSPRSSVPAVGLTPPSMPIVSTTISNHVPHVCPISSPPKGIIDAFKSRYVGPGSAISFPLLLSRDLNSSEPFRLHSYAWNTGLRKDNPPDINRNLHTILTFEEVRHLCAIYFATIHPAMGFLDKRQVDQRCSSHWKGNVQGAAFEAIICGICALGSLFGPEGKPDIETELTTYAKKILDNISVINQYSIDHVSAWILRAVYLRATSKPHSSWIASSTIMHMSEATGLHREIRSLDITSNNAVSAMVEDDKELRRKIFWVGWALNCMFSYEYGRTRTYIDDITCLEPRKSSGDNTHELIALAKTVSQTTPGDPSNQRIHMDEALNQLEKTKNSEPIIALLQVEMGFSMYRRLRAHPFGVSNEQAKKVLDLGKGASSHLKVLTRTTPAWWSLMGVPFQYACICLATNTPDSLSHLTGAMEMLEDASKYLNTTMAHEALKTVRILINSAHQKKQSELDLLVRYTPNPVSLPVGTTAIAGNGNQVLSDQSYPEWLDNGAVIDWDQFFFENVA